MKIKTSELNGQALAWAVAVSDGNEPFFWANREEDEFPETDDGPFRPDLDWSQGGPIIEREYINITHPNGFDGANNKWVATWKFGGYEQYCGSTPLIAAMRCYVASKLGDEIEIPEELT